MKTRSDNMKSIMLDMYFMRIDARAYHVSHIVSDMNDLGYDDWAKVPLKLQAYLVHANYRFDD